MQSPTKKLYSLSTYLDSLWSKRKGNKKSENSNSKTEQILQTTLQEMAMILDNTEEFFLVIDRNYKVLTSNQSAVKNVRRLLGGDIQKGSSVLELAPTADRAALDSFYHHVFAGNKVKKKYTSHNLDGSDTIFQVAYTPIKNEVGDYDHMMITARDITYEEKTLQELNQTVEERKKAEEIAKAALTEKQKIMDCSLDVICTFDGEGRFTQVSIACERLWGYTPEELLGTKYIDLLVNEDIGPTLASAQKVMEGNKVTHFENCYKHKQGHLVHMVWSANWDEGDKTMYCVARDTTENRKFEEALLRSNERFEYASKATTDVIWDFDFKTNELYWSDGFEEMFGHKIENNKGDLNDFNAYIHPEDSERVMKGLEEVIANEGSNWREEFRYLKKDGTYAYVIDTAIVIRDTKGEPYRIIGSVHDATKEKRQVDEIIRIQHNLDALINTTDDVIWSIDTHYKLLAGNKGFHDYFLQKGYAVKEGASVLDFDWGPEENEKWRTLYTRALANEKFFVENSYTLGEEVFYVMVSFHPMVGPEGRVIGIACYSKDITGIKRSEQKLKELNETLEKRAEELANSNIELERFAYVASHDLQEPLRMVSSFLQLLQRKYQGQLDEAAHKYIHFAVDGAERMKQLIKDLLQYSRIGTSALEVAPVKMNDVVKEVLLLFKEEMETKQAQVFIENLPTIQSGKTAMVQLIQNLLSNALKYSLGRPEIKLSCHEDKQHWIFTVEDNGIGIDPRFNEKIFVVFQRLHNKDEFSGTGIGLAICKKIVERYGGKIWVESEVNKGSKFIFSLAKNPS